jgi:hypothetical protein
MLEQLLDSRDQLAVAIALLAAANYFVGRLALAEQSHQAFVEYVDRDITGSDRRLASAQAQLLMPFVGTAVIIALVLVADRFTRELLGGGWVVMQVAGLGAATADVLALKALRNPNAASGRIRYSAGYRKRAAAARSVGMAVVAAAVGLLFGSWAFAMGALLMLATGAGWYRRASNGQS